MAEKDPQPTDNERNLSPFDQWWLTVRLAGSFLTRLPWPVKSTETSRALGAVASAFPVIGIVVGAIAGLCYAIASFSGVPPLAAAFIGLGAAVAATGALHEDGFADVADGFWGGHTKEDKLRIMKDSRIGAFGVLAIVFAVGLRVSLIGGLESVWLGVAALIGGGAVSRAALPVLMTFMMPARTDGLGAASGKPDWNDCVVGLIVAGIASLLCGFAGILGCMTAGCAAYGMLLLAKRHIGGQTGDVLGATQVAAEAAFYLGVVIGS